LEGDIVEITDPIFAGLQSLSEKVGLAGLSAKLSKFFQPLDVLLLEGEFPAE
jgi:hypothetical protein